tara:strand:- start:3285 stop:3485 length:201 start_codon:yes stop_codon:yes gene_type:complete
MSGVIFPIWAILIFYVLIIWSAVWKGVGLWRAGRNKQVTWFVFLFVFNTLGILPIVYLTWFQKGKK